MSSNKIRLSINHCFNFCGSPVRSTAASGCKKDDRLVASIPYYRCLIQALLGIMLFASAASAFAGDTYNPVDSLRQFSSVYANNLPGTGHAKSMLYSAQAWSAASNDSNQWIELPVSSNQKVVAIQTQGRANYSQWVKQYKVQARLADGRLINLRDGDVLSANVNRSSVVRNTVDAPLDTVAIRVLPYKWYRHISMRVALETEVDTATGDTHNPVDSLRHFSSVYANNSPGTGHAKSMLYSAQAWSAARNDRNQWIELPVSANQKVVAIQTQGRANYSQWVKQYKVQARLADGQLINLRDGDVLSANVNRSSVVRNTVDAPLDTVAIRILPYSWYRHISMRVALVTEVNTATGDTHNPVDALRQFSSVYANNSPGTGHAKSMLHSAQAWSAASNDSNQWIELPVNANQKVVGIQTQGRANYSQWVKQYQVQARLADGRLINLRDGDVLSANVNRSSVVRNTVDAPLDTVAIRILPYSWYRHISMRVALLTEVQVFAGDPYNPVDSRRQFSSIYSNNLPGTRHAASMLHSGQAWSVARSNSNQWMEIPVDVSQRVIGIQTQGRANYNQWVKQYQVQARLADGRLIFLRGGDVLSANVDRNSVVRNTVYAPLGTVAIRLLPYSWHGWISMRVALETEVHECDVDSLLSNGSFEEHGTLNRGSWGTFTSLPGWQIENGSAEIQRGSHSGIVATDGEDKLELDSTGNSAIYADVNTTASARYKLTLDYTPRVSNSSTNGIDVLWNGNVVAQLSDTTVGWQTHAIDLIGGATTSRLTLRASGQSDGYGGLLDNISIVPDTNLISNGSFEQHQNFTGDYTRVAELPGWEIESGLVEIQSGSRHGIRAVSGDNKIKLAVSGNRAITTDLPTDANKQYRINLYYSPQTLNPNSDTNRVEVWWNDQLLKTLDGSLRQWQYHSIVAPGATDSSRLRLVASGHSDDKGGLLDNISVHEDLNLLGNGSFEAHGAYSNGAWGLFNSIPGWQVNGGPIELQSYSDGGIAAAHGTAKLELDSNGNNTITANISTASNYWYTLGFSYSPRLQNNGTDTNDVEVWWNGELINTLSGDRRKWRHYSYRVPGGAGSSTLEFRASGTSDSYGGLIDDVYVHKAPDICNTPITNTAPVVTDINGDTFNNQAITVALQGTDSDGDALQFEIASFDPAFGTGELQGNQFTYTPDTNFSGTAIFSYTASDGTARSTPAAVTIAVIDYPDVFSLQLLQPQNNMLTGSPLTIEFQIDSEWTPVAAESVQVSLNGQLTNYGCTLASDSYRCQLPLDSEQFYPTLQITVSNDIGQTDSTGLISLVLDDNANGTADALDDDDNDGLDNETEATLGSNRKNADTDNDGLPDGLENQLSLSPLSIDTDGDGVADGDEDSDNDGLSNKVEFIHNLNPGSGIDALADLDGDGLNNLQELLQYGTLINNPDTDADGLSDGLEIALATNPLNTDSDANGIADGDEDADLDGLSNLSEVTVGADPLNPDTDGDGLRDGVESVLGLSPTLADTDNNGVSDSLEDADNDGIGNLLEIDNGLDPTNLTDAGEDPDNDGLSNLSELSQHNTEINNPDTDADGLPDGFEVALSSNPTNTDTDGNGTPDAEEDADSDGLNNLAEYTNQTDPLNADTDADGLTDGLEIDLALNPLDPDTNGDGTSDANEDADEDGLTNLLEVDNGLDPSDPDDAAQDNDADGLTNSQELLTHFTDINDADSDDDQLPDGYEVALSLNPNNTDSNNNGTLDTDEDNDNDGLSNLQEYNLGTDPFLEDTDADGLPDALEESLGLSPVNPDTDGNGISDGQEDNDGDLLTNSLEVLNGLDPVDPLDAAQDPDADGLSNLQELLQYNTEINNADTDNDALPDGVEVTLSLDPTQPDTDSNGVNDADEDNDSDGLTNGAELTTNTDPLNPDSDADGLQDGIEVALGLNPLLTDTNNNGTSDGDEDTDTDGLSNLVEVTNNLDPGDPDDAAADLDDDGLSNLDELTIHFTDIANPDTDADGLTDGLEITLGTNPTLTDSDGDGTPDGGEDNDNDGLSNTNELIEGSDPLNPDSDGDGLNDGLEVQLGLEPTNADSDGNDQPDGDEDFDADGLANLIEVTNDLDPQDPADATEDRDNDGLNNSDELLTHQTDIDNPDTDTDGLPDGLEITLGLLPTQTDTDSNGTPDGDEDADTDGLSNLNELNFTSDPLNPDTDADGLPDGIEVNLGLDPTITDTDANGVADGDEDNDNDGIGNLAEMDNGLNPDDGTDADTDNDTDGLSNADEINIHGTNPNNADTDADTLPDGLELLLGLNPTTTDTDANGTADGDEDFDDDGLSNRDELSASSDPANPDTDADGLNDGLEVTLGLAPTLEDTDSNGIADGLEDNDADGLSNVLEANQQLDPANAADALEDADNDGLNNKQELLDHGTDIRNADTDADALPDGFEVTLGTDPLLQDTDNNGTSDSEEDADADGLSNVDEYTNQTDPLNADTDQDGLADGLEITLSLDPTLTDSDSNGIADSEEDFDIDGLGNLLEVQNNLNPADSADATKDNDADGLSNLDELLTHLTDINDADTDNDQLPDGIEVTLSLNPNSTDSDDNGTADAQEDADNDGLANLAELNENTDPINPDTDGDGLQDGIEIELSLSPINEDTDGNGTSDALEDADLDSLGNLEEINTHNTNPGQFDTDADGLGDGTEITLGLDPLNADSDGDGESDGSDIYPSDPDRSRLAVVENLQITLADTALQLQWDAHTDPERISGYQLQRRANPDSEAQTLLTANVDRLDYTDSDVSNGQYMEYRVVAIDTNGEPGEAGDWQGFHATYNSILAEAPQTSRDETAITLNWTALINGGADNTLTPITGYRVYRSSSTDASDIAAYAALTDVQNIDALSALSYRDEATDIALAYHYKLATLATFTHPLSNESVTREGPLSEPASLEPFIVYELLVELLNGELLANGDYRQQIVAQDERTLIGRYTDARGDVRITATLSSDTTGGSAASTVSNNGEFTLSLGADGQYQIVVQDLHPTQTSNRVELNLLLVSDTVPPQMTLADNQALSTAGLDMVIRGTASDDDSVLRDIYATNAQFQGSEFQGSLQSDGQSSDQNSSEFDVNVPLLHGPNLITVFATDASNNTSSITVTIERAVSLTPSLTILQPVDNSTTDSDRITVSGTIFSQQDITQLRVRIDDELVTPEGDGGAEGYTFSLADLRLNTGSNTIVVSVESPGGNTTKTITLNRTDDTVVDPGTPESAPTISIIEPLANAVSNNGNVRIRGNVLPGNVTDANTVELTIDGSSIALDSSSGGDFSTVVPLNICDGSEQAVVLIATDNLNRSTTRSINIACDDTAPQITLLTPANLVGGIDNTLLENPVPVSGIVEDTQIAGLTINGQSVTLAPQPEANQYRFNAQLMLTNGEPAELAINAWDRANNQQSLSYSVVADLPVRLAIISPAANTTVSYSDDPVTLDVVADVQGLTADHTVQVLINEADALLMNLNGSTATLAPTVTLLEGENTVVVEVLDQAGDLITRSRQSMIAERDIVEPLALVRSEPVADSEHQLPNEPITLYFNQNDADFDQLEIVVTQSVHGPDYDLSNQRAASFTEIPEPELIEVHMDHAPVTGSIARYPGDQLISFYPSIRFQYGASVFVEVKYQGESLARYGYSVQELPTQLVGIVTDSFANPLSNILVRIDELGLETSTNENGNFDFGAGEVQREAIDAGRYTVMINPDQANPGWGVTEYWANVQKNRINAMGYFQLPRILGDEPFVPLSGGKTLSLYKGALELDLTNAALEFPNGRTQGNAQVQMLLAAQLPHPSSPGAVPQFAWHLQPTGIRVSGDV